MDPSHAQPTGDFASRADAAAALDAFMEARGWSARALGRALGIGADGALVSQWRRGQRIPPPWLAIAIAAVDAGDEPEALDATTLRARMDEAGWSSPGLAAALGVARAAVIRWRIGRLASPRGLALAIREAGRRTPPAARRAPPGHERIEAARLAFEHALRSAHILDRRLRSARYHDRPAAVVVQASGRAATAQARAAEALRDVLAAAGWSERGLGVALGVAGHGTVARWHRGDQLPPAWLALALAALDAGDEPGELPDAAAVRARMDAGGWNAAGLAAALGVARAAVIRWRNGRTAPSRAVTLAITEAERRTPPADRRRTT